MATDISGIEHIGLDDWVDTFDWPIPQNEFDALSKQLDVCWMESLAATEGEDQTALLCEDLPGWFIQYAHAALVASRARARGMALISGSLTEAFYDPHWSSLGTAYENELATRHFKLHARRAIRNVVFNRHLSVLDRVAGLISPTAVALGSNDVLRAHYVRSKRFAVDNTYIDLFAADRKPGVLSPAVLREINRVTERICNALREHFDASLDGRAVESALRSRLATLMTVYRCAQHPSRAIPLLVTESARPLHKAAACGWRTGKGTAVGFHHGHAVGEFRLPHRAYSEFFAYDEFVCPTQASAEAFHRDYASTRLTEHHKVRFVGITSSQITNNVARRRTAEGSSRIHRIMLMGFPMNGVRYPRHQGTFWASQLELEIRLARLLTKRGFEVIYKVHPERQQPVSKIMQSLGCRVIAERLEDVTDMADAFLVKYIGSSTFPILLASDKPVFVLDPETSLWNPEHRSLLARRCRMLPAHLDHRGRIRFDEEVLLSALTGPREPTDYAYVALYYG